MTTQQTFHIKNFERLQHYKDRSPPWIKLYNGLLDDYEFARLPDASKAHLIAIGLLASRYSNKIPLDAEWIARRINATSPVDLQTLIKSGFVIPDQDCSNSLAECLQDARPERERETEVEREKEKKNLSAKTASRVSKNPLNGHQEDFNLFYDAFPKHEAKGAAKRAYAAALKRTDPGQILKGAIRYAQSRHGEDIKYTAQPATWLRADRWLDEGKSREILDPIKSAELKDKADQMLKRGRYAEGSQ